MKVDVHNHAIPAAALDAIAAEPSAGVVVRDGRGTGGRHVDFTIEPSFGDPAAKLADLAARGIDGAVVSAAPPLLCHHAEPGAGERIARAVNASLAAFCAEAPDRLRWMACVPLQAPGATARCSTTRPRQAASACRSARRSRASAASTSRRSRRSGRRSSGSACP